VERHDFRRWQKKIHFLLTTLKVIYVLTTPMPELLEDDIVEAIRRRLKWEIDDYICKGDILNGMSDPLFDIYQNVESAKDFSNKKPKLECWKCGKTGHFKRDCRSGNKKNNTKASGSGMGSKDQSQDQDRCWFKIYEPIEDGFVLYMGDDHFALVYEKGSVVLEFSSGKCITLFNVLYVPKLRFGYDNNGMFMLNLNKVLDDSGSVYISSSTVVNTSLWHACLGHGHYKRMLKMSKDALIPAINENPKKYNTCMLTKITRQPFKSITRKSIILELIHSDLCDFHATPSLGIIPETTAPYTPQQNGITERKNRALKEMVNFMKQPNLSSLHSWGCRAVVRLSDPKRKTLGEKGIDYIFVGYAEHSKAYRLYVIEPNDSVSINTIIEPRDEIFDENHAAFWKEAIGDEIGSIMENNTWVLSNLPPGCKPLGCKWVFKRKMKVDGTIDNFKVQLVIQGFRQKEGINYFDTYALVARITTIRLLLALAAIHNLVINQMDVKTTFLNGDLEEEVYMKQPEGFIMPCNEHKVYKLVKSLYGLKQAPKQ
ncbi:zinc finger, CCHC-type containing protein, partial [Tanacetum coccineum]